MQLQFVYRVASRLSQKKLLNYLNGSYNNYVSIDSSVHIRNISQQPIEFAHYVLWGLQQIISQSVLILITIIAILIFNPVLFPLLFIILAPPVILIGILMKKKIKYYQERGKNSKRKKLATPERNLIRFY
jgi:ABC-type multidrug transport system fused ATPase/permease subunit